MGSLTANQRTMSSTRKNLLLVACVTALIVPGMLYFYLWSARIDRSIKPEMVCFNNLSQIEEAELEWAVDNHKTTNDTPTWTDLHGYLRSTNIVYPAGGTYSLVRVDQPPTCCVAEHTALYREARPHARSPGR
jgi:hypothetical protein